MPARVTGHMEASGSEAVLLRLAMQSESEDLALKLVSGQVCK